MIGLDTNVLLRYLTQDDPRQSPLAARFVDRRLSAAAPGHVSLVCLAEALWVLGSRYHATRGQLVAVLSELLSDPRFVVQEEQAVWQAIEFAEQVEIDLPDALIAFVDRERGCQYTVTFDAKAARIPGMRLLA